MNAKVLEQAFEFVKYTWLFSYFCIFGLFYYALFLIDELVVVVKLMLSFLFFSAVKKKSAH